MRKTKTQTYPRLSFNEWRGGLWLYTTTNGSQRREKQTHTLFFSHYFDDFQVISKICLNQELCSHLFLFVINLLVGFACREFVFVHLRCDFIAPERSSDFCFNGNGFEIWLIVTLQNLFDKCKFWSVYIDWKHFIGKSVESPLFSTFTRQTAVLSWSLKFAAKSSLHST